MLKIYTDGSSCGNPGRGGAAAIMLNEDETKILDVWTARYKEATNNYCELQALIAAVDLACQYPDEEVVVFCDSAYCVNAFNDWIYSWASNNWFNSKKEEVKNIDLMKILYKYTTIPFPNFSVVKIKGHAGNIGNELADAAATNNLTKFTKILNDNNIKYPLFENFEN